MERLIDTFADPYFRLFVFAGVLLFAAGCAATAAMLAASGNLHF